MSSKQVIIVRRDMKLRRSEVASLVARVSTKFMYDNRESTGDDRLMVPFSQEESEWFYRDQKVIVLGVPSEGTLKNLVDRAEMQGLTVATMEHRDDDGKNGIDYPLVCAAIGPHDEDAIDAITGNLKLM